MNSQVTFGNTILKRLLPAKSNHSIRIEGIGHDKRSLRATAAAIECQSILFRYAAIDPNGPSVPLHQH